MHGVVGCLEGNLPGVGATPWANAPQAVQDWFAQNWPGARGRTPPPGMPPRLPFTGWTRNPGGTVTSPGVAGPTLAGRQPLPVSNVGRSPVTSDLLTPNAGVGQAPVPMPGGGPGGLLGMLLDPAQHANLRYPGMANAPNRGYDWQHPANIVPIPGSATTGFGGLTPQGLGTPVNIKAAVAAGKAAQPGQDAALQAAGSGGYQDAMWAEVQKALGR